MPVPLQAHRPGGSWLAVERPGQDYPMGVERKDILILPGAQIYSKLGEERHSLGGGAHLAQGLHTHQFRQHLEECLFHDPKELRRQQPGQSEKHEDAATTRGQCQHG